MNFPEGALQPVPQKVQLIGYVHLASGIMNLVISALWAFSGLVGILTVVGVVACCPAFILFPIALLELYSAFRHLSGDQRSLRAPRLVGYAEIASALGCSTLSVVAGIVTLALLGDPEVRAWYGERGGN